MKSPFETFGSFGATSDTSVLSALRALARTLRTVEANSTSVDAARDAITTRGWSVWAAPTSQRVAEALSGTTGPVGPGQFRYRAGGPLGERALGTLSGATPAAGLPWTAMAFWDGTQFRGIILWAWTGDVITAASTVRSGERPVTTPATMFSPMTGDNEFRRVLPVIIDSTGDVLVNGTPSNTGFQFSSAQNPTSNGYHTVSFFSQDDGSWGIQPGARTDGDTPGAALGTGAYGFNNYNSSEPVTQYFWGGPSQPSSNFVGVVFSA